MAGLDARRRTPGALACRRLSDWVLRFNRQGPDGLIDGKPVLSFAEGAPGKAPLLDDAQRRALAAMIEAGPIAA